MDLRDILKVLRRNWILVLASTLLGVLVAGGASLLVQPTYTANTRLFVAIQNSGSVSDLQQGNSFSQARVQSYVETARTPVVLQPVIDDLGLEISPRELAEQVSASADLNTVLITLTADSDSPVESAAIAQSMATSLVDAVSELESSDQTQGPSPVKMTIVTPATAPQSPSAPNTPLNLVAGFIVGLVCSVSFSILRASLDSKIRTLEDIRRITKAPLLGGIASDSDAVKKPLLTQAPHQSPRAESFRQIRTNLQFTNVNSSSTTTLVTSSLPGEGKSTTASNMAIALAQSGKRVVLVDADLRRPTLADYLGLERNAGLTTALVGNTDLEHLLQPWGEDELYVLTSGQIPPNPSELLGSEAMSRLIARLESTFDAVIIDAPPLVPVTDASVLAQKVGGVVLVVGASKIRNQDLEKSMASLELVKANVLGVVVNFLPAKGPDSYSYGYYSYHSKPGSSSPSKAVSGTRVSSFGGSHMKVRRRTRNQGTNFDASFVKGR